MNWTTKVQTGQYIAALKFTILYSWVGIFFTLKFTRSLAPDGKKKVDSYLFKGLVNSFYPSQPVKGLTSTQYKGNT